MNTETSIHWATGISVTFHQAPTGLKWTAIEITDADGQHRLTIFDQPDLKIAGNKWETLHDLKKLSVERKGIAQEAERACGVLREQLNAAEDQVKFLESELAERGAA